MSSAEVIPADSIQEALTVRELGYGSVKKGILRLSVPLFLTKRHIIMLRLRVSILECLAIAREGNSHGRLARLSVSQDP